MIGYGPTAHLNWVELGCKDGTPYPNEFRVDGRALRLAIVFENIRSMYDEPISIFSAYRTLKWNKKIGGAKYSQHLYGKALDLAPPEGITIRKFYNDIRLNTTLFGINGLGRYLTFIHVDIRPSSRLIVWSGSGVKDS